MTPLGFRVPTYMPAYSSTSPCAVLASARLIDSAPRCFGFQAPVPTPCALHRGTAVLPADVPSLSPSVSPAGTIYPLRYVSGISIGIVANWTCTGVVSATASPIDVRPASSPRCTHPAAATTTHLHHHSHSRIQRTYVTTDKKTKTKHKL